MVTMGKIVILITVMAILLQLTAVTYARKHEGKFQRCSQMFQRRYFFLADDNSEQKMCEIILTFISVKRFPMTYGAIRFHLLQKRLFNSVAREVNSSANFLSILCCLMIPVISSRKVWFLVLLFKVFVVFLFSASRYVIVYC